MGDSTGGTPARMDVYVFLSENQPGDAAPSVPPLGTGVGYKVTRAGASYEGVTGRQRVAVVRGDRYRWDVEGRDGQEVWPSGPSRSVRAEGELVLRQDGPQQRLVLVL